VFERGNKTAWSRYATDLYLRLRAHATEHGWIDKLRFLFYEDLVTGEDAERMGDLRGILLQSKPGPGGLSRNPHVAKAQLRISAERAR
jgi:hypothetical protein